MHARCSLPCCQRPWSELCLGSDPDSDFIHSVCKSNHDVGGQGGEVEKLSHLACPCLLSSSSVTRRWSCAAWLPYTSKVATLTGLRCPPSRLHRSRLYLPPEYSAEALPKPCESAISTKTGSHIENCMALSLQLYRFHMLCTDHRTARIYLPYPKHFDHRYLLM